MILSTESAAVIFLTLVLVVVFLTGFLDAFLFDAAAAGCFFVGCTFPCGVAASSTLSARASTPWANVLRPSYIIFNRVCISFTIALLYCYHLESCMKINEKL
jgi:hypothetical protein